MIDARFRLLLLAATAACFVGVESADAGIVTGPGQLEYIFDKTFSGATPPGGTPYLSALFEDVSATTVKLTIDAGALSAGAFIDEIYFNFEGILTGGAVGLSIVGGSFDDLIGTVAAPSLASLGNNYKADGDGWYDALLTFQTSGGTGRFGAGESVEMILTRAAGLSVADFFDTSELSTHGFYAAAHVQGFGDSGWVRPATDGEVTDDDTEVPEPASLVLAALGSLGAIVVGRRRQAQVA